MAYSQADGQLAATATSMLGAVTGAGDRYIDVLLRNTNTSSETVELLASRNGGTQRSILKFTLAAGEAVCVAGLYLSGADVLYGSATDAAQVDYQVTPSTAEAFSVNVYTTAGGLKTATTGAGMGTQRLPLLQARRSDYTVMSATNATGEFAFKGTVGTATELQGNAAQNTTKTDICLFEFVLPPEYPNATNISLLVNVQRVVASGTTLTTTIDAEVWAIADDGTAGSDIQATTVITFTNTTAADKTFTITGTTLSPGMRLLIRLTGVATEAGNAGTVLAQISSVRLVA